MAEEKLNKELKKLKENTLRDLENLLQVAVSNPETKDEIAELIKQDRESNSLFSYNEYNDTTIQKFKKFIQNCNNQLSRDNELRLNGDSLSNMISFEFNDIPKRKSLEVLVNYPKSFVKKCIFTWGDPNSWEIYKIDGNYCRIESSNGVILNWISEEDAQSFVNYARELGKNSIKDTSHNEKELTMTETPKYIKRVLKDFRVDETEFNKAVQRKLREAKRSMDSGKYKRFKNKLKESSANSPSKFVSYIGTTDPYLSKRNRVFKKLSESFSKKRRKK